MSRRERRNLPDVDFVVCVLGVLGVLGLVGLLVGALGGGVFVGGVLVICVLGILALDVLSGLLVGALGGLLSSVFGGLLGVVRRYFGGARARRPGSQAPAHGHTVPPLAVPRSLKWVRRVLPGSEGAAWLAEANSCLTETPEEDKRRQYVRDYRRKVPQLIWTSWALHLRGSRKLS